MSTVSLQPDRAFEYIAQTVSDSTSRVIVILESPISIKSFLTIKAKLPSVSFIAVAVTPEVCWNLEQQNLSYIPVDSFSDSKTILRKGIEHFTLVRNICNKLDLALCNDYDFLNKYSIRPAEENFQFIKILFDELMIKTMYIKEIIRKENPALIISFEGTRSQYPGSDMPFERNEHIFDMLLREWAWNCDHVSITPPPHLAIRQKQGNPRSTDYKKILKHRFPLLFCTLLIYIRYGIRRALTLWYYYIRNAWSRKGNLCIAGYGGEWLSIVDELIKNQYGVCFIEIDWDAGCTEPYTLKTLPDIQVFDDEHGNRIDLSGIFIRKLEPVLARSVYLADTRIKTLNTFFKEHNIRGCLYGSKSRFFEHLPARLAISNRIPVISWQHGAAGYFEYPVLYYTELLDSTHHVVWGYGVLEQLKEEFPDYNGDIHPAGSHNLQCMYNTTSDKVIHDFLYITTNYFYNTYYIGYSHLIQDTVLWRAQKQILQALGSQNYKTGIKLHPEQYHSSHFQEYIAANRLDAITIYKQGISVESLIQRSGAIIIDFPSTTLLQAIATKKTIFILLEFSRIKETAKIMLQKRAYCAGNVPELLDMLDCYVNKKPQKQSPDPENTEFLQYYGMVVIDERVQDRVIDILEEAVREP